MYSRIEGENLRDSVGLEKQLNNVRYVRLARPLFIYLFIKFHCTHHNRCKKRFTYTKGII